MSLFNWPVSDAENPRTHLQWLLYSFVNIFSFYLNSNISHTRKFLWKKKGCWGCFCYPCSQHVATHLVVLTTKDREHTTYRVLCRLNWTASCTRLAFLLLLQATHFGAPQKPTLALPLSQTIGVIAIVKVWSRNFFLTSRHLRRISRNCEHPRKHFHHASWTNTVSCFELHVACQEPWLQFPKGANYHLLRHELPSQPGWYYCGFL